MLVAKMIGFTLALWTTLIWAGDEPKGKPVQEEVFVLGKDLIELLEKDPDTVILQGEKARQYLESVKDRERSGAPSVLIQQCQIRGELLEDQARLQVDVTVRSERDGRRPVLLGLGEGNLLSAKIDGGSPFLTRDSQGWTAWVEGPGQHTISVALQRSLVGSRSLPALVCTIPEAPVTSLELKALLGMTDVKLTPAAPVTLRPVGDVKPQVEAALGPRGKLDLRWRWSDGQNRDAAPLLRAASEVTATVEAGVIQLRTELRLQVLRGSLATCELRTSPDERVLELKPTDGSVVGWQPSVESGEQRIIIHFPEPLTGSAELVITSEVPWAGDSRTLRGITVLGAHSHRSVIALRAAAEFDVAATELVNTRRTDTVPPALRSPRNEAAFAAYAQPFQLKLSILPRRSGTSVRTTALISCDGESASVVERWQFTVHGGKVSQVDFLLPQHFEAGQFIMSEPLQAVREEQTEKGRLAHVFLKGNPNEFELRLRATVPLVTAQTLSKLDLPVPLNSASELSRAYLAGAAELSLDPTPDFHPSDEPLDAGLSRELNGSTAGVRGFQTRALLDRIAFRQSHAPVRHRHVTRARVMLDEVYATVNQVFEFSAMPAATRELHFAVPESVLDALNVEPSPGQIVANSPQGDLKVRIGNESTDPVRIQLSFRQPILAPDPVGGSRALVVPLVRAVGGPCDFTEVSVLTPPSWSANVSDSTWHAVIGAAARTESDNDNAQLLVRRLGDADSVPLQFDAGTIASQRGSLVDRAFIETVVGSQGEWHTRARFRVVTATGRLRMRVPRDGRITRIRWEGKPISARPAAESDGLELTEPIQESVPGILDVEAEGIKPAARGPWSAHEWEAPALLGDVSWGRVFWQLTLPDRWVLLRGPMNFSDENRVRWRDLPLTVVPSRDVAEIERWLTGSDPSDSAPTSGENFLFSRLLAMEPLSVKVGNRPALVLVSSGCVLLLGLIVVVSPRRFRIVALIAAMILMSGFSVLEPVAAIAAARSSVLGLVLVVIAGGAHAWTLRRSTPRRTVFPEAAQLAKAHGSSARAKAEFALGQSTPDAPLESMEPKTTVPRLATRSSSGR
jgi:hypothetical protein